MKLSPYPMLLVTGALMVATVLFAQTGNSVNLLRKGVQSVDKDISSYVAEVLSTSDRQGPAASGAVPGSGALDDTHMRVALTERTAGIDDRPARPR
jgi:hypothetical protein